MANGKRPDYRVFVSRQVGDKNYFTEVGAAWHVSGDGISIKLHPNIAVSDSIVLFPPKEDDK